MRHILFLLTIVVCASGTMTFAVAQTDGAVGRGDFEYYLDLASFRGGAAETAEEIYIRVPNSQIRFQEVGGRFEGRVELTIRITNPAGKTVVRETVMVGMYADSEEESASPYVFQTHIQKYELDPGRYTLSCALRDKNAPKMTMVGMVRGELKTSLVDRVEFDVLDFSSADATFSGAQFLWDIEKTGSGTRYDPNPSRLYGLYRDSLQVYIESYVPTDLASAKPLSFETSILDESGETVSRSSRELPKPTDGGQNNDGVTIYPIVVTEDLNRFPAGSYTLFSTLRVGDDPLVRVRSGKFSVAWDIRTWELTQRYLMAEARFLLDKDDYDAFKGAPVGEQERILKKMWSEIDPDPTTGVNEAYQKFLERLALVNTRYSDYQLGFMTDRGIIHLKYGAPDDRVVDVIPLNRETISDALEKVNDRFHAVNFSNSGGRNGYANPSRNIVVDPRRLGAVGEGGDTAFPFELWVYNGKGDPILKGDQAMETNVGLRFIFVDREGFGRYKLESSSSLVNK